MLATLPYARCSHLHRRHSTLLPDRQAKLPQRRLYSAGLLSRRLLMNALPHCQHVTRPSGSNINGLGDSNWRACGGRSFITSPVLDLDSRHISLHRNTNLSSIHVAPDRRSLPWFLYATRQRRTAAFLAHCSQVSFQDFIQPQLPTESIYDIVLTYP